MSEASAPTRALTGLSAFVTGGGRGIGAGIASALRQSGAAVTIAGRDRAVLEETAAALGAEIAVLDVTVEESVRAALAGRKVDILVNNAGAVVTAPFEKVTRANWDATLAVNLTGAFLCSQAALPGMVERKFGRIINIASTGGLAPYRYVSGYVAAKHGLIGLTRALALETAKRGVTVNAICPGYSDTDMVHGGVDAVVRKTGRSRDEALQDFLKDNPQGRLISPHETGRVACWLSDPQSGAITGQSIVVAGGEVMH